jgi:spore germination cell wall hydrolase CwlJ-like protein
MESYLADLQQQSKSLNEQISILTENMEEKEAEIAAKEAEVAEAQETLDAQYADMKQRIQYMYENEQDTVLGYLTALLTGGISDLLNQVEYAMSINSYDRNMMENFKESKSNLEEQQAELEDEQDALALLKEEVEEKQAQVASQEKEAGTKLSSYNDMIAELEKELGNTEQLIEEKTKLLDKLIAKAAAEEEQARIEAAKKAAASMNGVTIIAGDAGISTGTVSLSDYEMLLLATMIYCEAGNQGTEGQLAVGYVIMNRLRSKLYPNTLEAVLRQSKQFEPVSSGRFDLVLTREQDSSMSNLVTESCWNAARTVVNGTSNVGESLFFRTWKPVPQLITNLENGGVPYWIIKDHIFYYYWTSYSTSSSSSSEKNTSDDTKSSTKEDEEDEDDEPSEASDADDLDSSSDESDM